MTALINAQADVTLWRPGVGAAGRWYGTTAANLAAAKAAAQSGDTIVVGPGAYATAANLAKNGVNWHLSSGCHLSLTGSSRATLFDDGGAAMTFAVTGEGTITAALTGDVIGTLFSVANAGSSVSVDCALAEAAGTGVVDGGGSQVFQVQAGSFTLTCRHLKATGTGNNFGAWSAGVCHIHATRAVGTTGNAGTFTVAANSSTTVADNFYYSGDHLESDNSGNGIFVDGTVTPLTGAGVWVDVLILRCRGTGFAIYQNAQKWYVTAQKIFGVVWNSGGKLYLRTEKLSYDNPGQYYSPLVDLSGSGELDATVTVFDPANATALSVPLVRVSGGDHRLAGLLLQTATAGDCVGCSGGSITLAGTVVKSQPGSHDLAQTGGTLAVTPGVVGSGASGALVASGTITRLVG